MKQQMVGNKHSQVCHVYAHGCCCSSTSVKLKMRSCVNKYKIDAKLNWQFRAYTQTHTHPHTHRGETREFKAKVTALLRERLSFSMSHDNLCILRRNYLFHTHNSKRQLHKRFSWKHNMLPCVKGLFKQAMFLCMAVSEHFGILSNRSLLVLF